MNSITNSTVRWAEQHSWYRGAVVIKGKIGIRCYDSELDKLVTFTNKEELRAWAGY